VLTTGESLFSLRADSDELVPRSPSEFHWLLGSCRDLEFLEETPQESITESLACAVRREQALDLVLILLEPHYTPDIRAEAAQDLAALIDDPVVVEQLESVMFSTPLPPSADLAGAVHCSAAVANVARWLERLGQLQALIAEVRHVWLGIAESLDASGPNAEEIDAAWVRAGVYRSFVMALAEQRDLGETTQELLRNRRIQIQVPEVLLQNSLTAWQRMLSELICQHQFNFAEASAVNSDASNQIYDEQFHPLSGKVSGSRQLRVVALAQRLLKRSPPRLSDEVFQNVLLATVQTVYSRQRQTNGTLSPDDLHRELMDLFVATVGRGYLTQTNICRASEIFWSWVPHLLSGSII
jgi:hypothetical protein